MLSRTMVGIVALALLSSVLVATSPQASASRPIMTIADTLSRTNTLIFEPLNHQVIKLTFTSVQQWAGDWVGINVFEGQAVLRVGKINTVPATGTFTGTVLGKFGTLTLAGATIFRDDGSFMMDHFTIIDGTGELENLRGHVGLDEHPPTFELNDRMVWWIHFEP